MSDPSNSDEPSRDAAPRPGLARPASRQLGLDLDALVADKMMARFDAGSAIALDLDAHAGLALPTLGDIQHLPETPTSHGSQSLQQIEALLSIEKVDDLAKQGSRLNELLDRGAATIQERTILRRGMLFFRGRLYREAEEWWQLNMPAERSTPFGLLLQVLLAVTCRLQGNETRAAALLAKIKPEIDRLSQGPRV